MFEVPGRRQADNDLTLLPEASKSPPPAAGQRLASGDFEGGKDGAVAVLGKLGFTVQHKP